MAKKLKCDALSLSSVNYVCTIQKKYGKGTFSTARWQISNIPDVAVPIKTRLVGKFKQLDQAPLLRPREHLNSRTVQIFISIRTFAAGARIAMRTNIDPPKSIAVVLPQNKQTISNKFTTGASAVVRRLSRRENIIGRS